MDKKNLMIGVIFILAALYCVFSLVTKGFASFYLSGAVLFLLVGLAFIRRAKSR